MKLELDKEEWKSNFNKLVCGLINGNDVKYFCIDKELKEVSFLFGDYNVVLREDGTWEIG